MARIITSVEQVSVNIALTSPVDTALTKGQNPAKCTPWYTVEATADLSDEIDRRCVHVSFFDNAGTPTVRCERGDGTAGNTITVRIFVIEWAATITVQQVTGSIADTATSGTINITNVGSQGSAFLLWSAQLTGAGASDDADDGHAQVRFNGASTTQVLLERRNGSVGALAGTLYVVKCSAGEFVVKHEDIDVTTNTATSQTKTIEEVDPAATFLIHTYETNAASDNQETVNWLADLQDGTTLRIRRTIGGTVTSTATSTHTIQVVEAQNGEFSVQRNAALALDANPKDDTIADIDQLWSFINNLAHYGHPMGTGRTDNEDGTLIDSSMAGVTFLNDTTVRYTKKDTTLQPVVSYEVVQFENVFSGISGGLLALLLCETQAERVR